MKIVKAMNKFAESNNDSEFEIKEYDGVNRGSRNKDYQMFAGENSLLETGKEYYQAKCDIDETTEIPNEWWSMEYTTENDRGKLLKNDEREVVISLGNNDGIYKANDVRKEYRITIYNSEVLEFPTMKKVRVECKINNTLVMEAYTEIDLAGKDHVLGNKLNYLQQGRAIY